MCAAWLPDICANNDLTAAISVVGARLQINEDNRDYGW